MKRIFVVFALALIPFLAAGQVPLTEHTVKRAPDAPAATAPLEEFAWLAGRWTGEGLGGRVEELWTPADGGAISGMFRLIRDDAVVFYEIFTLRDAGEGLSLRLKHFNADLTAWEEKEKFVEFRYVGAIDGIQHFEGLGYRREGEEGMTIFLALRGKDGVFREEVFRLKRED